MPIIKSSANGADITVIVFDKREIDALVILLSNASFANTPYTNVAAETIEDLFYALQIPYPPEFV